MSQIFKSNNIGNALTLAKNLDARTGNGFVYSPELTSFLANFPVGAADAAMENARNNPSQFVFGVDSWGSSTEKVTN